MNTFSNPPELEANALDVEVRDERIWDVVGKDALLEQVATGFQFLEGPLWHSSARHLIFSDILGDTMYRWRAHLEVGGGSQVEQIIKAPIDPIKP